MDTSSLYSTLHPVDFHSLLPDAPIQIQFKNVKHVGGHRKTAKVTINISSPALRWPTEDESIWKDNISVFQFNTSHHINGEIWNLSSEETQRNMLTGHSGQCSPLILWACFLHVYGDRRMHSGFRKQNVSLWNPAPSRKRESLSLGLQIWDIIWPFPL